MCPLSLLQMCIYVVATSADHPLTVHSHHLNITGLQFMKVTIHTIVMNMKMIFTLKMAAKVMTKKVMHPDWKRLVSGKMMPSQTLKEGPYGKLFIGLHQMHYISRKVHMLT
jgi:hypothetical protein